MPKYIFIILMLFCTTALAVSPDIRISDNAGNVADISSSGELEVSQTLEVNTNKNSFAMDRRISDSDGNVLDIASNGTLQGKWG